MVRSKGLVAEGGGLFLWGEMELSTWRRYTLIFLLSSFLIWRWNGSTTVMVQPFCSVYTKDYRRYERDPKLESPKPCVFYSDLKDNFLPAEDSKAIYNAERDEAVLKEVYLKRLITTYQLAYCSQEGKKSLVIDPNNLDEDQLMAHFNHYYSKKTHPVPRPLDTARNVFNYSRFDYYYTGKSTYEEEISREAYEFFKRDYDEGKSRLFRKKQKALQEQKEPEKPEEQQQQQNVAKVKPQKPPRERICAVCCEKFGDFCWGCKEQKKN